MSNAIVGLLELVRPPRAAANGKTRVRDIGFLSCADAVDIKYVPFYQPCLIVVLAGRKLVHEPGRDYACVPGQLLAVPGPASFHLRNEPESRQRPYRALIIPFERQLLQRLARAHDLDLPAMRRAAVHRFECDRVLVSALRHYLDVVGDSRLRLHRLMEILLILVRREPRLLVYSLHVATWSERVRAVLSTDLTRAWDMSDLCARLATSESTLRRRLRRERTSFRRVLQELRLSAALMSLLQTSRSVQQIAYDSGYLSLSRFSHNFQRRFGLPPSRLRLQVNDSDQKLIVAGKRATG